MICSYLFACSMDNIASKVMTPSINKQACHFSSNAMAKHVWNTRVESKMGSFKEGRISLQKLQDGQLFPKVILPAGQVDMNSLLENISLQREWLEGEFRDCGALLFRGFPMRSASDFNAFVEAFGWEDLPYKGSAVRIAVVGRVSLANDGPLDQPIFFHHEMSKRTEWPSKLFFFCEIPPPEGGQTAIVQSHRVAERIETKFPEIAERLESQGVLSCTMMPMEDNVGHVAGKSWRCFFKTDDPAEAEKRAADAGGKIRWMEDGGAEIIRGPIAAIKTFEGYDRKVVFNCVPATIFVKPSVIRFTFCDGSAIPSAVEEECVRAMNEECVEVQWEAGDVVWIDNLAVMHARRPSMPPRRVLAALCK